MKAASKHRVEEITPEEEKDVKRSLQEINEGRFKQSKDAEEVISWLKSSPDSERALTNTALPTKFRKLEFDQTLGD